MNGAERAPILRPSGPRFPIVGIGASAGGLEAFTQLLGALPLDTGMGFVLVQHLDPDHESALTQILGRATSLPIKEIINDDAVEPNHVYVIPRDTQLTIAEGILKLSPRSQATGIHRPINAFFDSLAQDRQGMAVGVVLSGTATDGTLGLEAIKAEGGITFAQDESAKYDSMPRNAVAAGCVDLVMSPAAIAEELARIAKHPYVAGQPLPIKPSANEAPGQDDATPLPSDESGYKRILTLLRNRSGVDFSFYKSSTIRRRITRRLVLNKQNAFADYATFLSGNTKEIDELYSDVLIGVTSFFRNPEVFEVLQNKVFPELLKRGGDEALRCWVLGCSTGQEAYSIAIAFAEASEKEPRMRRLQIFATDLNEVALEKARQGLYAKSIVEDVTPERLRRYFVEEDGGYRISKALRDTVVFARQNLIADPPFSRMDLVSCRNLLIYLEPSLQKKALPTFHYALRPEGFLLLGASESISGFSDLFEPLDKKQKIYTKKLAPTPGFYIPVKKDRTEGTSEAPSTRPTQKPAELPMQEGLHGELSAQREADRITVSQFGPPGVLVNSELAILQFRGATGAFLEPPIGKASFDVLKMAREGLMLPLRSALNQAKQDNQTVVKEHVVVQRSGEFLTVNIHVIPLKNLRQRCFLILFEDVGTSGNALPRGLVANADVVPESVPAGSAVQERRRIVELESEAAETRDYFQAMHEQYEAAHEELQAANEEVQSANEELQSVNEELETSKEELESTNEELTTVNEEMTNRNAELSRTNNDLTNLQASTKLPILLLGRDLTLRRFSPQAEKQFDLLVADVGRPISNIRHNLFLDSADENPLDLARLSSEVISEVREQECEVREKRNDRWHSLRVRPYMTSDNRVDGAVLVMIDITDRKRAEEAPARLAAIVSSSDDAIISLDLRGIVQTWNQGAQRLFGYTSEEAIGKSTNVLLPPNGGDEESGLLARVANGEAISHYETVRQLKSGNLLDISLTISPILNAAGRIVGAAKIARDISDRKRTENELRRYTAELANSDARKNEFLAMLGHELRNPLSAISNGLEILGHVADDRNRSEQVRGMLVRQAQRIGTLLDQLLDIARVISGKVELSRNRVDLRDVIAVAVETVESLVASHGHTLTVSVPPDEGAYVTGDAVRLSQVVENLLTNAVKYTHDGGQIGVTLEASEDECRISVLDTGIGIAGDFLPHVFEVFTQSPRALDRSKGGLGLGLPLVHRLVEMHGGRVSASSHGLGKGSQFIVTLPRVIERRSKKRLEGDRALVEKKKVRPLRILVVDDEKDSADTFAELLEIDGHKTLAVNDGPAALEAVRTFDPEVVLLDLGLPVMDGFEIAEKLRKLHPDNKIFLVAVTGYQSDIQRLKEAGFDQHLIKPPNMQKLAAMLAAWDSGNVGKAETS